jgi:hypothetical protein
MAGISRWRSPRRYACAHAGCPSPARITAPGARHTLTLADGTETCRAHNCCGAHEAGEVSGS